MLQAKRETIRAGDNAWLRKLKVEVNVLLDRESQMWSQWSRVLWLTKGDQITKYFHTRATKRHRKDMILGITNVAGIW